MEKGEIQEFREFFLEASCKTYAGGWPKTTIAELPKSKAYWFGDKEGLLYCDCYFAPSDKGFGTITIWRRGVPRWGMQYWGGVNPILSERAKKYTIQCLKAALYNTYQSGIFIGGRGPLHFAWPSTIGELIYENHPADPYESDFTDFGGYEIIYPADTGKEPIWFRHDYHGIAL